MGSPALIVLRGAEQRTVPIGPEPITIGRTEHNQLAFPRDKAMSGHHANIHVQDGDVFLVDQGSRNGTLVNGHRITEARLSDGDEIRISRVVMRFVAGGADAVNDDSTAAASLATAAPAASSRPEYETEELETVPKHPVNQIVILIGLAAVLVICLLHALVGDEPTATRFIYPVEGITLTNAAVVEWERLPAGNVPLTLEVRRDTQWQKVCDLRPSQAWVAIDTRRWPDASGCRFRIAPAVTDDAGEREPEGGEPSGKAASSEAEAKAARKNSRDRGQRRVVQLSPSFAIRNPARWRSWENDDVPAIVAEVPRQQLGQRSMLQAERVLRDKTVAPAAYYRAILLLKQAIACFQTSAPERAAHAHAQLRQCQRDLRAAADALVLALQQRMDQKKRAEARRTARKLMELVDCDTTTAEFAHAQRCLRELGSR